MTRLFITVVILATRSAIEAGVPNIVIFHPDDMYQAYGNDWNVPADPGYHLDSVAEREDTAYIDRIANEGANFTRAHTASGMCAPSRLAMLTGRYASRGEYAVSQSSGQPHTRVTVPRSCAYGSDLEYNFARALKSLNASYTTGAFGKWHVAADETLEAHGCVPGFASEYDCDYSHAQQSVRDAGFDVAEAIYISNLDQCDSCVNNFSHNTEWITYESIKFMRDAIDSQRAFFAYVNPVSFEMFECPHAHFPASHVA
eukprot:g3621.t1